MMATLVAAGASAAAVEPQQTASPDRFTIPFSDPARPGLIRASLMTGSITVKAYSGREVIVTSTARENRRRQRSAPAEAGGLRRIDMTVSGLTIEEESNVMSIRANQMNRAVDIEIQVPTRTNLKLATMNDGVLTVEGVEGDVELNNHNGDIVVTNGAGSVVASSHNGDVTASMRQITAEKPMSLISFNGKIDVTLPEVTKANLKMRTDNGDIYSDFEVQLRPNNSQPVVQDNRNRGGRYRVEIDRSMIGAINGGGPDFELRTYNGNIYVRKGAR
jgi:DUF4097 and DUF4098 domain-containing protein YvlB